MKSVKNSGRALADARQLEQAGKPEEAAAVYQQIVDADPVNQEAVERLLVIYRRQKEYKNELAVIEGALAAYAARDKANQEKWISAHPGAAKVGRQFLRSLGGAGVSAFGSNPVVERLLKRKEFVGKRLGKKPGKKGKAVSAAARKKVKAAAKREAAAEARRAAAEEARRAVEVRRAAAAEKAAKKAAERAAQKAAKQAAKKTAIEVKMHPSLFVITLRYLVPLEKIDAVMKKHVAFLDKHFSAGDFLVSGRQVPRTGGVIIARAKDRASVERIMKQDPFLKGKLASVDIVEFIASKFDKSFPYARQKS